MNKLIIILVLCFSFSLFGETAYIYNNGNQTWYSTSDTGISYLKSALIDSDILEIGYKNVSEEYVKIVDDTVINFSEIKQIVLKVDGKEVIAKRKPLLNYTVYDEVTSKLFSKYSIKTKVDYYYEKPARKIKVTDIFEVIE